MFCKRWFCKQDRCESNREWFLIELSIHRRRDNSNSQYLGLREQFRKIPNLYMWELPWQAYFSYVNTYVVLVTRNVHFTYIFGIDWLGMLCDLYQFCYLQASCHVEHESKCCVWFKWLLLLAQLNLMLKVINTLIVSLSYPIIYWQLLGKIFIINVSYTIVHIQIQIPLIGG